MQAPPCTMQSTELLEAVGLKAKFFRGFADGSRLSILETLRQGPLSVGEIVDATGLSQSNTSNHLACLLDCGLVSREQQGRRAIYLLRSGVEALLSQADDLTAETAAGLESCPRYAEPATE